MSPDVLIDVSLDIIVPIIAEQGCCFSRNIYISHSDVEHIFCITLMIAMMYDLPILRARSDKFPCCSGERYENHNAEYDVAAQTASSKLPHSNDC